MSNEDDPWVLRAELEARDEEIATLRGVVAALCPGAAKSRGERRGRRLTRAVGWSVAMSAAVGVLVGFAVGLASVDGLRGLSAPAHTPAACRP